jgi:hypothetical protein
MSDNKKLRAELGEIRNQPQSGEIWGVTQNNFYQRGCKSFNNIQFSRAWDGLSHLPQLASDFSSAGWNDCGLGHFLQLPLP